MGRPNQSLPALALAILTALAVASCGGDDAQLLPGTTARDITANLNTVRQLADQGDCVGAESAALQVSEQVKALEGIDVKLKRALEHGAARLNEVVTSCEEAEGEETTTTTAVPTAAERADEKAAKKEEKAREKEEREREREAGETNREEESGESTPTAPAQGEGQGNGKAPTGGEESGGEDSSGGVGPGTPLEGEG